MRKKTIKNLKKLESKDLNKIKGGIKGYMCINGEWVVVDYPD